MHVAVDARFAVLDERGIGRYTRALIAQFRARPDVVVSFVAPGLVAPRARIARVLGVERGAVVARVPAAADVLWGPSNATDLPVPAGCACVTTVHDVVPYAFPAADERVRERERAPLRRTAQRAHRIVADSAFEAGEIARWMNVPRERVSVAPLGVDAAFSAAGVRHALPDGRPYILHVGAHDARKNIGTLIAAWQRAFPERDVALVFTRAPARVPPGAFVAHAPGDDDLARLYRGAAAVAVPSLDEGFGLPLLEALACAVPAVASRVAALPEVGGDVPVWIGDPLDVGAWAAALGTAVRDRPAAVARAMGGPERAATFTWERCATLTFDALRAARDAR
jgi:glycosyltransferase involved in cell wall biosynthesis